MSRTHALDDEERWQVLLGELRVGKSIGSACRAAGVSRRAAYAYVESRPERAAEMIEAQTIAVEALEEKMYEAAYSGERWAIERWLEAKGGEQWRRGAERSAAGLGSGGVVMDPSRLLELAVSGVEDDSLPG